MLRNVVGFPVWGLAGSRLLATGQTDPDSLENQAMKIEQTMWTLPEHWASALINDDFTGLSSEDEMELNSVIAELGAEWFCVGLSEESYFTRLHDARLHGILACDVLDYEFQRLVKTVDEELAEYYDDEKNRDAYNMRMCEALLG